MTKAYIETTQSPFAQISCGLTTERYKLQPLWVYIMQASSNNSHMHDALLVSAFTVWLGKDSFYAEFLSQLFYRVVFEIVLEIHLTQTNVIPHRS